MALAVLWIDATSAGTVEAAADIGSNSWFEYLVGNKSDGAYGSRWGDEEMAEVLHRSGPRPAPRSLDPLTRQFRFTVPLDAFDRYHPYLQLVSYADRDGNGAARSRAIRVAPVIGARHIDTSAYDQGPPRTLSAAAFVRPGVANGHGRGAALPGDWPVRRIPLAFQESAISRAQFVDGLLQLLQAVAPTLIQALPQLLGGGGGDGNQQRSGGNGQASSDTDALVALLRQVVAALPTGRGTTEPAAPPAPPAPVKQTSMRRHVRHPLGEALSQRRYAAAFGARRSPYARAMDGGVLSGPLLAALLGPLVQQAPQLLGVLADKPLDFLATILRTEAQNSLQREANQQAFIRELLAQTNRSMLLDQLVQRMGGGGGGALLPLLAQSASATGRPRAEASRAVTLSFEPGHLIEIGGKMKSVFEPTGDGIDLRFVLKPTGKAPTSPLPRAVAELVIVDPETGKTHCAKSFRLTDLWIGRPIQLHLEEETLAAAPRHRDLQVTAELRWPTAQGRVLGVRGHHAICLVDGPSFAGFGRTGDAVLHLAHPGDYRPFWNKVWEGSASADPEARRWEIDVLCRYYVRVTGAAETNGRMETRIAPAGNGTDASDPNQTAGRMRAGMEISIDMLNEVATREPPLAPAELSALRRADLRADLDLEATTRLRLRGKDNELGAIWAFPSLMLRETHFVAPISRDAYGQVTEMNRTTRVFPVPDRVHFLPMRTKG
jgi:hypothetical protein